MSISNVVLQVQYASIFFASCRFETKDEKSEVKGYGKDYKPNILVPGKKEGMESTKDVEDYMSWSKFFY